MEDSYLHKGLRKKLVENLRNKGITDERVLKAIETIPRHLFIDSSFVKYAYNDQSFPIGYGQTISQPYTVAFQTQLLDVQKNEKILEIGTGSGYQAAVLMEMGAKVYSIERNKALYLKAKALLNKLGYNPYLFYGDGFEGLPTYAPFDKIIVTAALNEIPNTLLMQLNINGKLVAPVGDENSQKMILIIKEGQNKYLKSEHGFFTFVPFIRGKE